MVKKNSIKLFGDDKIRAIWDDEQEKWYFSIVDVIAVLTESPNPQTYWRVLKKRLKDEGNESVTNCNALKMRAADLLSYSLYNYFHKLIHFFHLMGLKIN